MCTSIFIILTKYKLRSANANSEAHIDLLFLLCFLMVLKYFPNVSYVFFLCIIYLGPKKNSCNLAAANGDLKYTKLNTQIFLIFLR